MFGFDVKQIFTERIYEIIFILCSVHLGIVMVSFLLKWIHPYLKSWSAMHNNHKKVDSDKYFNKLQSLFNKQNTMKENSTTCKNCYESKSTISEEECISLINYLQTCIDLSSIRQEVLKKQYNKGNILHNLSLEIDNAINVKKLIKDNLNGRKSTSEAQTNITISPTFKADCSSPKLIFSSQSKSCDIPLHISESCDSFQSVCSNNSESEESKFMSVNYSIGIHDVVRNLEKKIKSQKTETVKHDNFVDVNSFTSNKKVLKTHVESIKVENHNDYEKQVCQENKILEIAINEFENELKPIKDQIKVLKECLHNFDCCETDNSLVSDLSSSNSDPTTQSECYSEEMSATYTSGLKSFSSKRCKLFEQKLSPLKAEIQRNSWKPTVDKKTPLLSKFYSKNSTLKRYKMYQSGDKYNKCPKEICILEVGQSANDTFSFNKRSPMADMYIKLSHCSSHTANFVKNNSYKQKSSDKSLTCHINLNFSVGAVTLSGTSIKNCINEREIEPVLSEPEDILGETSQTDISLEIEKNNNEKFS